MPTVQGLAMFAGLILSLLSLVSSSTVPAAESSDWPAPHRDNQRSGFTSEALRGPFERKWFRDFHDELIATRVEAVAAEGKVFVGTLRGKFRALSAENGNTLWTFDVAGPIGASPCYAEGRIFFGSDDGNLYCLSAASGRELWRYAGDGGFWAAPTLQGGRIYLGDRSGVLHAVDAATGKRLWTIQTDGMILAPASLSADGGKIVFTSEEMRVYCADPAGNLLWKSPKLGGLSLRDHGPTIWQGLAIVRTNPAVDFHKAAGENPAVLTQAQKALPGETGDKVLFDQWGVFAMKLTPRRAEAERTAILKFLAETPNQKTFYALQLEDGKEPWTAPVLYTAGLHNTPTPPTFNPKTGELYLWVPTALGNYHAGVPGGAVAIGRLDRATGRVDIILHANAGEYGSHAGFCPPADETFALSLMDNTLLNTHQGVIGQMDLGTRRCSVLFGQRDTYGGIFGPAFTSDPWKDGPKNAHLAGQLVLLPNEWHGPDRGIAAIADGRIFWVVGGQVVCIGGPQVASTETGGTNPPPQIQRRTPQATPGGNLACTSYGTFDASAPKPVVPVDSLRKYLEVAPVNPPRQISPLVTKTRNRLDTAVDSLVCDGPWAPLVVELGISGEERHFYRAAETMQILALALPHLSPPVQVRAKRRLEEMFRSGMPLRTAVLSSEGKRREPYDLGPAMLKFAQESPHAEANIEDIYAVWALGHYGEAWPLVLEEKAAIMTVFRKSVAQLVRFDHADKDGDAAERLNAQMAGTLAYARIMGKAGDTAEVSKALDHLGELLSERALHELADTDFVRSSRRARNQLHQASIPRYGSLTPEVAAMLRDTVGDRFSTNVRMITGALPLWHHAYGERMIGGENYISSPSLARALFAALSDGVQAAPAELAAKLDQPWGKGDLYWIEKLTAVLRALERQR